MSGVIVLCQVLLYCQVLSYYVRCYCIMSGVTVLCQVLLYYDCAGGEIETNEMGRACGAYGGG